MYLIILCCTIIIIGTLLISNKDSVQQTLKVRTGLYKIRNYHKWAFPLIGHAHLLPGDPSKFFEFMADLCTSEQQLGHKLTKLWLGPRPLLLVHNPETAETIMKSSRHIQKSNIYDLLNPWLGTGLLTSSGDKWRSRRRLLTPAFHFSILKDFLLTMNVHANTLVDILNSKLKCGQEVDLNHCITMAALDIICDTAMGETVNAQSQYNSQYVNALYEVSEIIMNRVRSPLHQNNFYFYKLSSAGKRQDYLLSILHGFSGNVIKRRLEQVRSQSSDETLTSSGRLAFLDLLLYATTESGERLSFSDIQEEVDTFMFEGHDTTAAALTWLFYQLGHNPNVQTKLQKEVDSVISTGDLQRDLTAEDFSQMPYLSMVIKESLRQYPSVPYIARHTTEDCMLDGFKVPKGAEIAVMCYSIHHHEQFWKNPFKFDPERFNKENQVGRHAFSYIPFSAGARNCIGQKFAVQEMKTVVCKMVKSFHFTSHDDEDQLLKSGELILRPTNKLNITLTSRL